VSVFLKPDVLRVLLAAHVAAESTTATARQAGADSATMDAYQRGHRAALLAAAVGFGLEASDVEQLLPGRARLDDMRVG